MAALLRALLRRGLDPAQLLKARQAPVLTQVFAGLSTTSTAYVTLGALTPTTAAPSLETALAPAGVSAEAPAATTTMFVMPTATAAAQVAAQAGGNNSLSQDAIGAILGSIVAMVVIVLVSWFCCLSNGARRRRRHRSRSRSHTETSGYETETTDASGVPPDVPPALWAQYAHVASGAANRASRRANGAAWDAAGAAYEAEYAATDAHAAAVAAQGEADYADETYRAVYDANPPPPRFPPTTYQYSNRATYTATAKPQYPGTRYP